jgi:hypothetical protein
MVAGSLGEIGMRKHQYNATLLRAFVGFCTGVALVAAIEPTAMVIIGKDLDGYPAPRLLILNAFALDFFFALFVRLLVIVTLGAVPIWIFFHVRGRRGWHHAAIAGALLAFIWPFANRVWTALFRAGPWETGSGDYTIIRPVPGVGDWLRLAEGAAVFAAIGCVAALIVWRIAYRRISDTPAEEVSPQHSPPPLSSPRAAGEPMR